MEAARTELLRNLTGQHLEAGKSREEIQAWLGVAPEFVEAVWTVMQRVDHSRYPVKAKDRKRLVLAGNPTLKYENSGRGGTIWFESEEANFDLWWEFAGSGALVLVGVPRPEHWQARTKLSAVCREEVLTFIGEQIVQDHTAGSGSFLIGDDVMTIYHH